MYNTKLNEMGMMVDAMHYVESVGDLKTVFASSFSTLKVDPNMKKGDGYRYRAFAVGDILEGEASVSRHSEVFNQSKKLNKYQGGIDRSFPLVDMDVAQAVARYIIMPYIYPKLPIADYHFGIHQIRTVTTDLITGRPAPEGIHQDGFDYVAVVCVEIFNITGGNSLLVDAKDHQRIVINQILQEGQMILFDDRSYAHYASPIVPLLPGQGHRDVFVVTLQIKK